MRISPGTRLGSYEIVALLGAGGMGEVYRARDLRLNREVALKTLPPDAAANQSRRQRFEQEGQAVAALNHPNIVGIYDVGTAEGVTYLVSELVDGEPLAVLVRRGPVPVRPLLDIAAQIAEGLAAAHAAGIVREGRVNILDFGLARQSTIGSAPDDRTATAHLTQPGMILGTINYMSPEQATGRPLAGDWIAFGSPDGWSLISPDGKTVRSLG